jgi:glycosyltransferase involved in cell wall biosynthesis
VVVKPPLRLLIWSPMPTHHQSAFFAALRARDMDLVVHYLERVDVERLRLGWSAHPALPSGEHYVPQSLRALESRPDWRERIHVVPGYNRVFLLRLALRLSREHVDWVHWSEHSHQRTRSRVTFGIKRAYGHFVNRHSLGALAIGELAQREFRRWGIAAHKIRFLPYAVEGLGESPPPPPESTERGVRFLFLGSLYPTKGIDLLLAAFRNVLQAHPDARLELAGPDRSQGGYQRDAVRLGIAQAVRFTPAVEASRVGAILQRCDALVLPSRHDGWGVVLNEAASLGKALIASDACGGAHHLVLPELNGFRFPSGDTAALTAAMKTYCADPALCTRHGAESLRLFADFTPARNAKRLADALESLQAQAQTAATSSSVA